MLIVECVAEQHLNDPLLYTIFESMINACFEATVVVELSLQECHIDTCGSINALVSPAPVTNFTHPPIKPCTQQACSDCQTGTNLCQ
jgi:hypothetical protein